MSHLNVLLVTYSFPPAGGVGVLRAASLARYFPDEDIRLDVLTTRNASAVGADYALLRDIPSEVTIHRTVTLDLPFGIKKRIKKLISGDSEAIVRRNDTKSKPSLPKRVLQDLLLPDPQVTWLPILARAARRIVKSRGIDVVLITVPPFSSLLLVERLRKQFPPLQIVIDFRDEWLSTAIDLVGFSQSKRARDVARKIERTAVSQSNLVIAVTGAAQKEIQERYPKEQVEKFCLIPNGFDQSKFDSAANSRMLRQDDRIVVSHIGTVYASTEPSSLVHALNSLPPAIRARLVLRFIGHIEEARFKEVLERLGPMVELRGFIPQREALSALRDSDYALLVQHGHLNVAAKFYDYIGMGKPILATVHSHGPERQLIEELRAGWWAESRDIEGIRKLFIDAVARQQRLQDIFQPDTEKIQQYERKALAKRYATLLHSFGAEQRGPTSQETPKADIELAEK